MHASNATNADMRSKWEIMSISTKKGTKVTKQFNRTEKESERITENRNIDKQSKTKKKETKTASDHQCYHSPRPYLSAVLVPTPIMMSTQVPWIPQWDRQKVWWKVSPTGGLPFSYPKHISQYGTKSWRHRTCDPRNPKGLVKECVEKCFPICGCIMRPMGPCSMIWMRNRGGC